MKFKFTILFFFSIFFILITIGSFFDISTKPQKSDIIVCMGGGNGERLQKSIQLLNKNYSFVPYIISSDANEKDRKRKNSVLEKSNFANIKYLNFSKNTYEELKVIKIFMKNNNYKKVLIVSSPPHSRRINFLINNYIKFKDLNIKYTVVSSDTDWWDKNNIFKSKKAIKSIISESFKLTYNFLYYSFISKLDISQENEKLLDSYKKYFIKKLNRFFTYI